MHCPTKPLLASLIVLATAGCQSPNQRIAVPMGDTAYLMFEENGVDFHQSESVQRLEEVPSSGEPLTTARDIRGEWAVVAYENSLAIVRLLDGTMSFAPLNADDDTSIGVHDGQASLISDESVQFYDLQRGQVLFESDLTPWMDRHDLDSVHYALPLPDQRFLLVGFDEGSMVRDPRAVVQRIDRSRGQWRDINTQHVPNLGSLDACTSDGQAIYLAGIHREVVRAPGPQLDAGRYYETLLVYRVDFNDFSVQEIVRQERHRKGTEIRQIAVHDDAIALTMAGGELRVYRQTDGVSDEPYQRLFKGEVDIQWLAENRLLVLHEETEEILTIPTLGKPSS